MVKTYCCENNPYRFSQYICIGVLNLTGKVFFFSFVDSLKSYRMKGDPDLFSKRYIPTIINGVMKGLITEHSQIKNKMIGFRFQATRLWQIECNTIVLQYVIFHIRDQLETHWSFMLLFIWFPCEDFCRYICGIYCITTTDFFIWRKTVDILLPEAVRNWISTVSVYPNHLCM